MNTAESLSFLDDIDRKILFELDRDSRQSLAELSRKLELGRDRIAYRLKKLQTDNVIRAFSTAINPATFGFHVYKTYLGLENNRPRIEQFLSHLEEHPRVTWFAECDGRWQLLFSIFAKSPEEFYELQQEILFQFSDIINVLHVYTVVNAWCFNKSYLLGSGSEHFSFGGGGEKYHPDELDFDILRRLAENSRISVKDLATELKTTPTIIRYRIEKLEKHGVITGYRIDLNMPTLGMSFFKAQLYFMGHDRHDQERLLEYCKLHPNVTYFIRQIGECMVEIELEVGDYAEYSAIIDEIRQKFSKCIRHIEALSLRRHSFKWIPF